MTRPRATRKPARSTKRSATKQNARTPIKEAYWIETDQNHQGTVVITTRLDELPPAVLQLVKDDLAAPNPRWFEGKISGVTLRFRTLIRRQGNRYRQQIKEIIEAFRAHLIAAITKHAAHLLRTSKTVSYPTMAPRREHKDKYKRKSRLHSSNHFTPRTNHPAVA